METKSIFALVNAIAFSSPSIGEKVTQVTQNFAQFKLGNSNLVMLRKEPRKGVAECLVLRNLKGKVVAVGLKKITMELNK